MSDPRLPAPAEEWIPWASDNAMAIAGVVGVIFTLLWGMWPKVLKISHDVRGVREASFTTHETQIKFLMDERLKYSEEIGRILADSAAALRENERLIKIIDEMQETQDALKAEMAEMQSRMREMWDRP